MKPVYIDVRERDEFEAEHIEHSINLPLTEFARSAPAILKSLSGQPILLVCRSGKRASLAAQQASAFYQGPSLKVYEGGILEWKRQMQPTLAHKKFHLPLMRQVQLVAGLLVLIGTGLAYFVNPGFLGLTGFVGAGLTLAGSTGFCGMAELLAKMPWNRSNPKLPTEICAVSPSSGTCSISEK